MRISYLSHLLLSLLVLTVPWLTASTSWSPCVHSKHRVRRNVTTHWGSSRYFSHSTFVFLFCFFVSSLALFLFLYVLRVHLCETSSDLECDVEKVVFEWSPVGHSCTAFCPIAGNGHVYRHYSCLITCTSSTFAFCMLYLCPSGQCIAV